MDTTQYTSWKPATLVNSKYELRVHFAEEFVGNNADDNGEVSTGIKFIYEVIRCLNPEGEALSNGAPSAKYRFEELLLHPKRNSSPGYVEMQSKKWRMMLDAIFGEGNVPAEVKPEDFIDRTFCASTKLKWNDFKQAEVPELSYRWMLGAE